MDDVAEAKAVFTGRRGSKSSNKIPSYSDDEDGNILGSVSSSNLTPNGTSIKRINDMVNSKVSWLKIDEQKISPRNRQNSSSEWMDNEEHEDEIETARLERIVDKCMCLSWFYFYIL